MQARGWTVRWCGVLLTRGCVSCNEDVDVSWLHAPCIERSDRHPPRCHPVPRTRDHVPCAAYIPKGILVCLQIVFPFGLPQRGGGLGGPRSHARGPPCPRKQATGMAEHAAGQFSRIRCMRRTPGATRAGSKYSVTNHLGCPPDPATSEPGQPRWMLPG